MLRRGIKEGADYPLQIEKLDEVVTPFLHPDFFFLNIGACDGVAGDPVYPLARKYHWRGIAVEPVPYNYEKLCKNFADEPQVILENAAISTEPQTFWYVDEHESSLPHIVSQIGSLDREHLLRNIGRLKIMAAAGPLKRKPSFLPEYPPTDFVDVGADEQINVDPELELYLKGIEIPCLTISELLAKHNVSSVDFLNIDAEGADYKIFGMIDFKVIRPSIICIETTSFDDELSGLLKSDLERENYKFARRFGLFSEIYVQVD